MKKNFIHELFHSKQKKDIDNTYRNFEKIKSEESIEEKDFIFTDFIDVKKYIDFKYEPKFSFTDLDRNNSDDCDWGFSLKAISDNKIHLSIPGRGGMASDIARNFNFGEYLWKISDEKDSVIRTYYNTEFEFTDISELKKVIDYALSHKSFCYSISQGINFYQENDFNDFKLNLLNNDRCPQEMKSLLETVTFDSAKKKEQCFRFDENKVISFEVYKNARGMEYLHVYYHFIK